MQAGMWGVPLTQAYILACPADCGFCCRCHSYCLGSSLSNSWEGPGRVTCKCGKVMPCRKSFDQLETETGGKFFTLTHRNRNLIVSYQERGINRVCQQAVDSFITHSLSSFASSCQMGLHSPIKCFKVQLQALPSREWGQESYLYFHRYLMVPSIRAMLLKQFTCSCPYIPHRITQQCLPPISPPISSKDNRDKNKIQSEHTMQVLVP